MVIIYSSWGRFRTSINASKIFNLSWAAYETDWNCVYASIWRRRRTVLRTITCTGFMLSLYIVPLLRFNWFKAHTLFKKHSSQPLSETLQVTVSLRNSRASRNPVSWYLELLKDVFCLSLSYCLFKTPPFSSTLEASTAVAVWQSCVSSLKWQKTQQEVLEKVMRKRILQIRTEKERLLVKCFSRPYKEMHPVDDVMI